MDVEKEEICKKKLLNLLLKFEHDLSKEMKTLHDFQIVDKKPLFDIIVYEYEDGVKIPKKMQRTTGQVRRRETYTPRIGELKLSENKHFYCPHFYPDSVLEVIVENSGSWVSCETIGKLFLEYPEDKTGYYEETNMCFHFVDITIDVDLRLAGYQDKSILDDIKNCFRLLDPNERAKDETKQKEWQDRLQEDDERLLRYQPESDEVVKAVPKRSTWDVFSKASAKASDMASKARSKFFGFGGTRRKRRKSRLRHKPRVRRNTRRKKRF